jgi:CRP-like cAMP-binding protein
MRQTKVLPQIWCRLIIKLFERLTKLDMVENNTFYFPLRKHHIANYTGLTAVYVSNVLNQFRRDGLISLTGRSLMIRDLAALQRIGNSLT